MNPEAEALTRLQSGGSMPLQEGDKARITGKPDVFTVMAFDGQVYRLQAQSGAELKAGRQVVERADATKDNGNHET